MAVQRRRQRCWPCPRYCWLCLWHTRLADAVTSYCCFWRGLWRPTCRLQTGDPPSLVTPQTPNPSPLAATATAPLLLQASASDAKFADYKPKVAFFFPGQGAQSVGMAADMAAAVPAAKQLFERASDILGYDLLQVCAEGARLPLLVCAGLCVPLCGDVGVGKREIVVSRALPCLLQHTGR